MERPEYIEQLIGGVDRYNPSNCHLLDGYLEVQLSSCQYDLLSNLAQLKLYQFNPLIQSTQSTTDILFLSLIHSPFSQDFNLCCALLADSFLVGAPLPVNEDGVVPDSTEATLIAKTLTHLSSLLQSRKFKLFWSTFNAASELAPLKESTKSYNEILVNNIAKEVENSFNKIQSEMMKSFTNLSEEQLRALIKEQGWKVDGGLITLKENESNTPKPVLQTEQIQIAQLAKLLARSQAA